MVIHKRCDAVTAKEDTAATLPCKIDKMIESVRGELKTNKRKEELRSESQSGLSQPFHSELR
jgi:hypothetical protein